MMFETVNDPVDVIAAFVGYKVSPVRFRWKGQPIRGKSLIGQWTKREGLQQVRFFSVEGPSSDTYDLCFDPRGTWTLCGAWS